MGFGLQLRLLLWKNFTLRRRAPLATLFEVLIPLVLFLILTGIRLRREPDFKEQQIFPVRAVPSAGIIPLLQQFCENQDTDEHGFPVHPNASIDLILNDVADIMLSPSLSAADDLQDLPQDYQDFLRHSNILMQHFQNADNFTLREILTHPGEVDEFLQNMSVPAPMVDNILNTTVNGNELFKYLARHPDQLTFLRALYNNASSQGRLTPAQRKRLLKTARKNPGSAASRASLLGVLMEALITKRFQAASAEPQSGVGPGKLANDSVTDQMATSCDPAQLKKLFVASTPEQQSAAAYLCRLSPQQRQALAVAFRSNINSDVALHKLNVTRGDLKSFDHSFRKLRADIRNLTAFVHLVQKGLHLASLLRLNTSFMASLRNTSEWQHNKGFVKGMWKNLGPILCGPDPDAQPVKTADHMYDYHCRTKACKTRALRLMFYMLTHNPKILYSPNGTAADDIIRKANHTLSDIGKLGDLARTWLNTSAKIRAVLQNNESQYYLGLVAKSLRDYPDLYRDDLYNVSGREPGHEADYYDVIHQLITTHHSNPLIKELDAIDAVAEIWLRQAHAFSLDIYQGFKDEAALVNYALNINGSKAGDTSKVVAGLVFLNIKANQSLPPHVKYKIRMNATYFTPDTDRIRDKFWMPGPQSWRHAYYDLGFSWLQDQLDRAIIDLQAGSDVINPGVYLHQMPYPCYVDDNFMFVLEHMMPLCMTVSWIYTVALAVQAIVYEKEQRLKEVMKMMGLSNAVHWVAWFITTLSSMAITVALLVAILKYGKVLFYSDPVVVWAFLMVFAVVTVLLCFLISVFFSKAKLAAACGGIIYFLSYLPYVFISIREEAGHIEVSSSDKMAASLFSTSAFGLGARYFALYEEEGVGVQWFNIGESPVEGDQFNLLKCMYFMVLDTFIYAVLVWYIEAVHPGSYGLPRPWYFPLQASYWFGHNVRACPKVRAKDYRMMTSDDLEDGPRTPHLLACEREPIHMTLGVTIESLTKVYKEGHKLAVDGLDLNLYEGQITSFLGHNGAGKTTTMSILTGLFPPTSGTANVYGYDIRLDMDKIRRSLGMCPQHNVLFDRLTVDEHLWFYARLKGMSTKDVAPEMDQLVADLGLPTKRHSAVETLSGGMKRKLSVAMAFVAGSRTVILDEPTAGVDPYARRAIWDLLIKYKRDRTILLSTHFMEEADMLGDRIAIISNGRLRCVGSSLFLKSHFGDGYQLTLVKKHGRTPHGSARNSTQDLRQDTAQRPAAEGTSGQLGMASFDSHRELVTKFITSHVPDAQLKQDTQQEFVFVLPDTCVKRGAFQKFFRALEQHKVELDIDSYGLTDTTLEEVFLKVTDVTNPQDSSVDETSTEHISPPNSIDSSEFSDQASNAPGDTARELEMCDVTTVCYDANAQLLRSRSQDSDGQQPSGTSRVRSESQASCRCEGVGSHTLTGAALKWQQFWALLLKRFHYARRNFKGVISQILLPAIFISIAMTMALSLPKKGDLPALELTPSMFPRPNYIPFANEAKGRNGLAERLDKTMTLPSGVGATCCLVSANVSFVNYTGGGGKLKYRLPKEEMADLFDNNCRQSINEVSDEYFKTSNLHLSYIYSNGSNVTESVSHKDTGQRCRCSKDKMEYVCDRGAAGTHPKELVTITLDTLQNITGRNISKYLLYTTQTFRLHRYGALSFGEVVKWVPPTLASVPAASVRRLAVREAAKAWYNNKGYHALPTYLNVMNNAILRASPLQGNPAAYGKDTRIGNLLRFPCADWSIAVVNVIFGYEIEAIDQSDCEKGITAYNHPFNNTNNHHLSQEYLRQGTDVVIAIFVIIAMSFVPASFVVFLVTERSSKAKHLQFVCGVDPVIYWLSNYVWDICNYLIPAFACVTLLHIFNVPAYASETNFPAVVCLFLLYGWSITPIMYPSAFYFSEASAAYVAMIVLNLFVGITATVTTFIMQLFPDDKLLTDISHALKIINLGFPNYCLGHGLMDLAYNQYLTEYYTAVGEESKIRSPFEWDLVTRNLVCMFVEGIVFFIITVLMEFRFFIKARRVPVSKLPVQAANEEEEDEDVACERQRVTQGDASGDLVRLENLTKVYFSRKRGKHMAVDRLCLGIPQGECFGLLGVNGAGKTSTFKMLTGDTAVTAGEALLSSHSIVSDTHKVHKCIGYCPQFDALIDEMTAAEQLALYARLRGVPRQQVKQVVRWAVTKLALSRYAQRPCKTYSGGNKRKLSTAIALIGNPPIIFLDEPTTGMDPRARRFLWDLVLSIIQDGRSVILTSHSMEECEALCTRLAIMVNGRFKCLGSCQHLKNRFGDGYIITVRVQGELPSLEPLFEFFSEKFPEATFKERHHNTVQYQLPSGVKTLAEVFQHIEDSQDQLQIEDYSVSQTTLDNVFINFARQQTDETEYTEPDPDGQGTGLQLPSMRAGWLRGMWSEDVHFSMLELDENEAEQEEARVTFSTRSRLAFDTTVNA